MLMFLGIIMILIGLLGVDALFLVAGVILIIVSCILGDLEKSKNKKCQVQKHRNHMKNIKEENYWGIIDWVDKK